MSDNWVVQNLENALETWNEKLSEIWTLITTTPQNFKGGNIWKHFERKEQHNHISGKTVYIAIHM